MNGAQELYQQNKNQKKKGEGGERLMQECLKPLFTYSSAENAVNFYGTTCVMQHHCTMTVDACSRKCLVHVSHVSVLFTYAAALCLTIF